jgi:hypothetical protein
MTAPPIPASDTRATNNPCLTVIIPSIASQRATS